MRCTSCLILWLAVVISPGKVTGQDFPPFPPEPALPSPAPLERAIPGPPGPGGDETPVLDLQPAAVTPADSKRTVLLKERYNTALHGLRLEMRDLEQGLSELEPVLNALARLMTATVELNPQPNAKKDILDKATAIMRRLEDEAEAVRQATGVSPVDVLQARYARLSTDLDLLRLSSDNAQAPARRSEISFPKGAKEDELWLVDLEPLEVTRDDSPEAKLQKARFDSAVSELRHAQDNLQRGTGFQQHVFAAAERVIDAGADLWRNRDHRAALLKQLVLIARNAEGEVRQRFAAGGAYGLHPADLERVRYQRAKAELRLARVVHEGADPADRGDIAPPKPWLNRAGASREQPLWTVGTVPLKIAKNDGHETKLLKEQYNAAASELDVMEGMVEAGKSTLGEMARAGERLIEVSLQLWPEPQDRVELLERLLVLRKRVEREAEIKLESGGVAGFRPAEYQEARCLRLDAELKLLQAREALQ